MSISVEVVTKEEFMSFSEKVHKILFDEERAPSFERINYALVCRNEKYGLIGYSTILELDAESAFMQNGGALKHVPEFIVGKSYLLMVKFLKNKYAVIKTTIFNTNIRMLKLASRAGFIIHGVEYYKETKNFKGGTLLNLHMESDLFNAN